LIYILGLSFNIDFIVESFNIINRNQDSVQLSSISGRTDIWQLVIYHIKSRPFLKILFGSGYGVSRLILNEDLNVALIFYVYHCHNAFLEHLFSMGILGVITYIILIFYNIKWLRNFKSLQELFSEEFTLHAIVIVSIFFLMSITEVPIGGKINPNIILYLFYTLALDKSKYLFSKKKNIGDSNE
jgi:O-antigen ligase